MRNSFEINSVDPNLITINEIENLVDSLLTDIESHKPKNTIQRSADYYFSGQDLLTQKQAIQLLTFLSIVALSGASIYVNPSMAFAIEHEDSYINFNNQLINILHCVTGTTVPALGLLVVATWYFFLMRRSENIPNELKDFLVPPLTENERRMQDFLTGAGSGISAILLAAVVFDYALPGFYFTLTVLQALVALVDNLVLHFLPLLLALKKPYFRIPFLPFELMYKAAFPKEQRAIDPTVQKTAEKLSSAYADRFINAQLDLLLERPSFHWNTLSYTWEIGEDFRNTVKANETAQSLKTALNEVIQADKKSPNPEKFDRKIKQLIEKKLHISTENMDKATLIGHLRTALTPSDLLLAFNKEFPRQFHHQAQIEKSFLQSLLSGTHYAAGKLIGFTGSFWVTAGVVGYIGLPYHIFLKWTKSQAWTYSLLALPTYFFNVLTTYCGYETFKEFYDLATHWGPRVPKLPLEFKLFPKTFIGLMVVGVYLSIWSYAAAEQLIHQYLGAAFWDSIRPVFIWAARTGIPPLSIFAMKNSYKMFMETYAIYFSNNKEAQFIEKLMVELTQLTQAMAKADPIQLAAHKDFLVEQGIVADFAVQSEEAQNNNQATSEKQSCWEWAKNKAPFFSSKPSIATTPKAENDRTALLHHDTQPNGKPSWSESVASLICCSWFKTHHSESQEAYAEIPAPPQ